MATSAPSDLRLVYELLNRSGLFGATAGRDEGETVLDLDDRQLLEQRLEVLVFHFPVTYSLADE